MKKKLLIIFYIISFVYILFNFSNIYAKDLVYEATIGGEGEAQELKFTKFVRSHYTTEETGISSILYENFREF